MKNTIAAVSLAFIIVLSGLTTCGSKEKTDNPVPKTEAAGPAVTHIGAGNFSLEWVPKVISRSLSRESRPGG